MKQSGSIIIMCAAAVLAAALAAASISCFITTGTLKPYHYEKYFYFMNSGYINSQDDESYLMDHGFDGGWNGNVVKTCVAFWIRRSIDGTAEEFFSGLIKLMQTYDGGFLRSASVRKNNSGDGTIDN